MDEALAKYTVLVEARKERWRFDLAAAEDKWVHRRQAVIEQVETSVPGAEAAHEGLIDFLSDPIDRAHEAAIDELNRVYQDDVRKIREDCGL